MADLTPAHRVVIDAMLFMTANILEGPDEDMAMSCLATALDGLPGTGTRAVDDMVTAGRGLISAWPNRKQRRDNGTDHLGGFTSWLGACMKADAAIAAYAKARLAQSWDVFHPQPELAE